MKKILLLAVAFSLITSFSAVNAQAIYSAPTSETVQDFHIDSDGYAKISQAKVFQVAGTSYFVRYYFGLAFIRLLVKTTDSTKVYRRYGDEITFSQIKEGDIINIEGKIEGGSDSLNVVATKLTNFSNEKQITGFKGIISGTGSTAGSLMLTTENQGIITVLTSNAQIRKGTRIIGTDLIRNGNRVTDATGTFDHATKTLDASVVVIYADMSVYKERNFNGIFKSLNAGNPQTINFVTTDGKSYTLNLNSNITIMRKNKNTASLKRFVEGDTIRIFGKIREVEEPIIDTEVIRNLNL
ncbi:MAG: hypothetical protein EXS59_02700 [Candidatus Taylorbacteria bacterium]|nr:hypothetical protein [Candidatus Taylorbacteria bacterium]